MESSNGKLYKARFNSGGELQNNIFPNIIDHLMLGISFLESKNMEGVDVALSSLSALLPPFKKVFKDYEQIKEKLNECRGLRRHWVLHEQRKRFPEKLAEEIYILYEEFWTAFNDAGAGVAHEEYISRDKRLRKGLKNL